MTTFELNHLKDRIERYDRLYALRDSLYIILQKLESKDPNGPCGQGPFTGNTRESRQVSTIHLFFTATRGGAPKTCKIIEGLQVEAWRLGTFLIAETRAKIKEYTEAMEAI